MRRAELVDPSSSPLIGGRISPLSVGLRRTAHQVIRGRTLLWMSKRICPLVLLAVAIPGCQKAAAVTAAVKPPEVFVASPSEEVVTEVEEFTGRTMAVNTVEIRARVTGYLDKIHFTDGGDVKAGELLAEVDPRSYIAEANRTKAETTQGKARLERMTRNLTRAQQLIEKKTITQEVFEQAESDHKEAKATLEADLASQAIADLNVEFTKITSPISGQISRRLVDPGNLIKADDTALATIVTLDPIHAYFDVDERTVLRIRRLIREGKIKSARESEAHVRVGLADEEDFPLEGLVNFVDNQVDSTTGTLRLRAVIQNAQRFLSPGMFVRVQLPIGDPHPALLVREEALGADQGKRFVYVVNDKDEIVYRPVTVGTSRGKRRVIESGVEMTDRVVVSGLQRVRPGIKVGTKPFVPLDSSASTPAPAPAAKSPTTEPTKSEHGKD